MSSTYSTIRKTFLLGMLLTIGFNGLAQKSVSSIDSIKNALRAAWKKKTNTVSTNARKSATAVTSSTTANLSAADAFIGNIVPPSPTAASLGKYADFPVNLYNGIPSISIPIHQLKSRNITVPITLNYHASGIKVGEVASWVGLGFSLDAGGVITRTVRGLPDETSVAGFFQTRTHYPNPDNIGFSGVSPDIWQQDLVFAAQGRTDFEQDIYMLNAMGRSYKLLFKSNGTILTIPHSDLKITADFANHTWEIILEDGTKLSFGGTNATEISDLTVSPEFYTFDSSWYLKTITSSQGDVVSFTYTYSTIENMVAFAQSDYIRIIDQFLYPFNTIIVGDPPMKTIDKNQNITILKLSSIESNNEKIDFIKESTARQDLLGDYALSQIKITPKNSTIATEEYEFSYQYIDAQAGIENNPLNKSEYRKRLQLDKLSRKVNNQLYEPWVFTYNPLRLPSRKSFAQDHWGYYNGATDNVTLLPKLHVVLPQDVLRPAGISTVGYGFFPPIYTLGSNRDADKVSSQAQILQSIQYPTGGTTKFEFEPNSYPFVEPNYIPASKTLSASSSELPFISLKTITVPITKPQYIRFSFQGQFTSSFLSDIGDNTPLCGIDILNSNGVPVWSYGIKKANLTGNSFDINPNNLYANLQDIGNYTFRISTISESYNIDDIHVSGTIYYETQDVTPKTTKYAGGVRIAKMSMYENATQKASEKLFTYEDPLVLNPISLSDYIETTYELLCGVSAAASNPTYTIFSRNSNSKFSLGSIQGGAIGYGKVTTMTDPLGNNGKTVSVFSNVPDDGVAESKIFPYPSTNPRDQRRGLLTSQTVFRKDGSKVTESTNEYNFVPIASISGVKAGILKTYSACLAASGSGEGSLLLSLCNNVYGYCGIAYSIPLLSTEQVNKTKTTERSYDQAGLNPNEVITDYEYTNTAYTQLTKQSTTTSKGEILATEYKYPYDFSSNTVYAEMVTKNIISPVVEQTVKLSNTQIGKTRTNFDSWIITGNRKIYIPKSVITQLKASDPEQTQVTYNTYDTEGNLMTYTEKNGVVTTLSYYDTAGKINLLKTKTNNLSQSIQFDYKPLVGISQIIDVNNLKTTYEYDAFGRLQFIKDNNGNIIKSYSYKFSGN